jgi:HK97 family phage major capsid protein
MIQANTANDLGSLEAMGQTNAIKLGKVAYEALKAKGIDIKEELAKAKNVSTEALDIGESSLYTTAIAGFIEKRLRPELVAAGVIKSITAPAKGADSVKIPLRSALITAADLGDNGQVSYDSGTYGSTTITMRYSYAAQSITHELLQFANVDLMAEELGEIGDAIARKVDSDIIAKLKSATTSGNGNLVQLGSGTYVDFDALVDARKSAKANYAKPDTILLSSESEATIVKLGLFTGTDSTANGALTRQGQNGVTFPVLQSVLGMKVVTSEQVDDDDIYLIDTARTGYIVRKNGVEVFDGRRSGYLAFEVIGAHAYGIEIVQPKAVYRIEENA